MTMSSVTSQTADSEPSSFNSEVVIDGSNSYRTIFPSELLKYRDLLYFMALRDIQIRYKQTALGVLWAVIQPLVTMLVFTIFFGQLLGVSEKTGNTPYAVFVYAGLLPWTLFASTVTASSQSLVSNAGILRKVYFPRLVIPLSSAGAPLIDFLISFIVFMGLMIFYGMNFNATLILMPILMIGLLITALGIGIFLAAATVRYRDFRHVVPFMIQIWFFLTPVIWPVGVVPELYQPLLLLNPMHGIINGFRDMFLTGSINWADLTIAIQSGVVLLTAGIMFFAKTEKRMADII